MMKKYLLLLVHIKMYLNINYEHIFSENENLKFIIYESKLYLKEVLSGKTESIREVDVVFVDNDKEEVEIIFKT